MRNGTTSTVAKVATICVAVLGVGLSIWTVTPHTRRHEHRQSVADSLPTMETLRLKPGHNRSLHTFQFSDATLRYVRTEISKGNAELLPAMLELERDADRMLGAPPTSVIDKNLVSESGNRHDYYSFAEYWWPNPRTSSGLPWIRKDGSFNRVGIRQGDYIRFHTTLHNIYTLALAYQILGNEDYAKKATDLMRVWFLNAATRMNPNLEYAQAIPGVSSGRSFGLIEFRWAHELVDAIEMLKDADTWTIAEQIAMKEWIKEYQVWLDSSPLAQDERSVMNNHGTWMDVQDVSILLFLGEEDRARKVCRAYLDARMPRQVEATGRQPLEVTRENGLYYSLFNLQAAVTLARLAENVNVDMWHYETTDGRGIRRAILYLIPFVLSQEEWPDRQRDPFPMAEFTDLLLVAREEYNDPAINEYLNKAPRKDILLSRTWLTEAPKVSARSN